jgi:uncharacterized coiled-coil DUF342 family protein
MGIVERLRSHWGKFGVSRGDFVTYSHEAADEIERLRELEARYWEFASKYDSLLVEIERLREENNDLKSALRNVLFAEVSHVEITEFTKEEE